MAINHWKLGGQPTSYNPLPTGYVNSITVGMKEYVVRFRAKCPSTNNILVVDDAFSDINKTMSLTTEFKEYEVSFKSSKTGRKIYIKDDKATGDITIEDITLVEKGTGKSTINGIDGFLSGEWSLHANTTVIDDETLELNATGIAQSSYVDIPCNANMNYIFSQKEAVGTNTLRTLDNNGNILSTHDFTTRTKTIKTETNASKIRLYLSNGTTGTFTFKRPMLVLGSQSVPYEAKRGERMVMPQQWDDGTWHMNKKALSNLTASKGLVLDGKSGYINSNTSFSNIETFAIEVGIETKETDKVIAGQWDSLGLGTNSGKIKCVIWGNDWVTSINLPKEKCRVRFEADSINGVRKIYLNDVLKEQLDGAFTVPNPTNNFGIGQWVGASHKEDFINATLYDFKLELDGVTQLNYDFTQPISNAVYNGGEPENLLPYFDSGKWDLHANTKVMGKDVLMLEATGADQNNELYVDVEGNTKYQFGITHNGAISIFYYDDSNAHIGTEAFEVSSQSFDLTTPSSASTMLIRLNSNSSGTFTFQAPRLIKVPSNEATINGIAQPQTKRAKRQLYAKR